MDERVSFTDTKGLRPLEASSEWVGAGMRGRVSPELEWVVSAWMGRGKGGFGRTTIQ